MAGAGLGSSDTSGFETHALIGLTTALAMAGDAGGARKRLAELNSQHPPVCTFLEPERMLAGAWVVASEGSISEAILIAHEAAGVAAQWRQHVVGRPARPQLAHTIWLRAANVPARRP